MSYDKTLLRIFRTHALTSWNSRNINGANVRTAYGITVPAAYVGRQLSEVHSSAGAVTGTQTNIGRCALHAIDANGLPTGAAIEERTFTPASATSFSATGFTSTAIWNAAQMAIVFRNADGSPTSNHYAMPIWQDTGQVVRGHHGVFSLDNSVWHERSSMLPPIIVKFSDGSRWGPTWARQAVSNNSGVPVDIYDARYMGVRFMPDIRIKIWYVAGQFRLIGTLGSAGTISASIFFLDAAGVSTLIATSAASQVAITTSADDRVELWFAGVPVPAGQRVAVIFHQTDHAGGDASNNFRNLNSGSSIPMPSGDYLDSPWGITQVGSSAGSWPYTTIPAKTDACQHNVEVGYEVLATRGGR